MNAPGRCYACYRPHQVCFCATIPKVDNRTEVLILQHRRERSHPFNTARIVQRALRNSQLWADHTQRLAERLQLKPRAGLLFPGPGARLVSDLAVEERPQQLVVLDGTWHHAKTLLRDIPALQALPRYGLAPLEASRYRIRREPSATSLSTVEAAVAALRILEPETLGLDRLLQAFDTMVENQLAHPRSVNGQRTRVRGQRTLKNIPFALLGDLGNIVVAYGESAKGMRGEKRPPGPPVSWVARRLGTGEMFSCLVKPPVPLDDDFLAHLALTRDQFAAAISLDDARQRWTQFRRPGDMVTVFHPATARLYKYLARDRGACLVLKSVTIETGSLESKPTGAVPGADALALAANSLGRAGQRLAHVVTLVQQISVAARNWELAQQAKVPCEAVIDV